VIAPGTLCLVIKPDELAGKTTIAKRVATIEDVLAGIRRLGFPFKSTDGQFARAAGTDSIYETDLLFEWRVTGNWGCAAYNLPFAPEKCLMPIPPLESDGDQYTFKVDMPEDFKFTVPFPREVV
jgi:hypothetical protein